MTFLMCVVGAKELHDEIGQSLTAATLNLAAMEKMIAAGNVAKILARSVPFMMADRGIEMRL